MATKRKALGKGLSALLPSVPTTVAEKSYLEIPVDDVIPNKYQPRTDFDEEQLKLLAQSIKSDGVIQPIIVRKSGGQYQLIAGERRWRAARLAGLKNVPAVIRDVSEFRTLEWALIENIQRQDLNPIEEATAYQSLVDDFHMSQEEVAQRVGKDRTSVTNYIRLLKLPVEIKTMIQRRELSMGHARALTSLERTKDQIEMARRIVSEQWNVRQTENFIRSHKTPVKKSHAPAADGASDPNVKAAQLKLQEHLGTRVNITGNKVEIYYRDAEDLMRVYDLLLGPSN